LTSAPTANTWVYDFADGSREMRDLLGRKGANLADVRGVHDSAWRAISPAAGSFGTNDLAQTAL